MSVDLMVEVLTQAPADLTPTERLTLVVIAESCRSGTRTTYYRDGWDAEEVARRVGITAESLTKVFRALARKGLEVRVPQAVKEGKPVFAFKGRQTTFRLPRFGPQRVDDRPGFRERVDDSPVFDERVDHGPGFDVNSRPKDWTSVRECLDESPGFGPQRLDDSPPLLLKELPSKNPSLTSLSPEDHLRSPKTSAFERDIHDSSKTSGNASKISEGPVPARLAFGTPVGAGDGLAGPPCSTGTPGDETPARRVLAEHRVTGADADQFIAWANRTGEKGDGWYLTLNQRGHMPSQIAQFRTDLAAGWPHVNQRSPADQRVAEGAALYARYAAREHRPYLNPAPEDVRRAYDPTKL